MWRELGRARIVLLEDLNGLAGEDPASAAFLFLGVIPSFSFKAGERMEANVENIFDNHSTHWDEYLDRKNSRLDWSTNTLTSNLQSRGSAISSLNKNVMCKNENEQIR